MRKFWIAVIWRIEVVEILVRISVLEDVVVIQVWIVVSGYIIGLVAVLGIIFVWLIIGIVVDIIFVGNIIKIIAWIIFVRIVVGILILIADVRKKIWYLLFGIVTDIEVSILYGSILWIELGNEVRIVGYEVDILRGFVDEIEVWVSFICIVVEVERGIVVGIISGIEVGIEDWDVLGIILGILL